MDIHQPDPNITCEIGEKLGAYNDLIWVIPFSPLSTCSFYVKAQKRPYRLFAPFFGGHRYIGCGIARACRQRSLSFMRFTRLFVDIQRSREEVHPSSIVSALAQNVKQVAYLADLKRVSFLPFVSRPSCSRPDRSSSTVVFLDGLLGLEGPAGDDGEDMIDRITSRYDTRYKIQSRSSRPQEERKMIWLKKQDKSNIDC